MRMAVRLNLHGISTRAITPFFPDGRTDFDAVATLMQRLVAVGVHVPITGGSTGENYAQTVDERLQIAQVVTEHIPVSLGYRRDVRTGLYPTGHGLGGGPWRWQAKR